MALLTLVLDALDQLVVVLRGDDVEHRESDGLLGRVPECRLERLVDLDDLPVDVDEHRVEDGVGQKAETVLVASGRLGARLAAPGEPPKAVSEAGGHGARIGIERRGLKVFASPL